MYIKSEMRGKGLGKIMLSFLAKLAVERNCGRFRMELP
ncbi:GNAT family N-acetyltransferase [Thermoanaerobacterium thermosaccharolyticum]